LQEFFAGGMMLSGAASAKEMVKCMGANSCKGKKLMFKSKGRTATHVQARMVARAKGMGAVKK